MPMSAFIYHGDEAGATTHHQRASQLATLRKQTRRASTSGRRDHRATVTVPSSDCHRHRRGVSACCFWPPLSIRPSDRSVCVLFASLLAPSCSHCMVMSLGASYTPAIGSRRHPESIKTALRSPSPGARPVPSRPVPSRPVPSRRSPSLHGTSRTAYA